MRLKDPGGVKKVDTGVVQLALTWDSRRPYNVANYQKVMNYNLDIEMGEGKTE